MRSGRGVEVFAFGTRLTRLTGELRDARPRGGARRAADRVVDWAAGTRIGASLKAYNDVWGRRAMTRGAVVADRLRRLGAQRPRARRARDAAACTARAHAVVWVNPAKGHPEYEPLAAGMRAALPSVDRFVAGHDVASLEALSGLLTGIRRPRHEG